MSAAWPCHWLDRVVGRALAFGKMFEDGFGARDLIDGLLAEGLPASPPAELKVELVETTRPRNGTYQGLGYFDTPDPHPALPDACRRAVFEWHAPSAKLADHPTVLALASSGEEGFGRRRAQLGALVGEGYGLVILENAFYGRRRPAGQTGPRLRTFGHQLLMNRTILLEARALLAWLRASGDQPLVVTGYSMGGYMAAYSGALLDFPVGIAACAAGLSPAAIYTSGQLSRSIAWPAMHAGDDDARAAVSGILDALAAMVPAGGNGETAVIVGAAADGFVPVAEVEALHARWPGSQVQWMRGGHVSAYVLGAKRFRSAVRTSFERVAAL